MPNLHLVEPDSVTLLETNQRFIESYMVGINHEFARELLWREYPTDQRGSYFRQFWDVRKKIARAADKAGRTREVQGHQAAAPLAARPTTWATTTTARKAPEPEEELVLVIRGELLKKYPNTIISAQPRASGRSTNGRHRTSRRSASSTTACRRSSPLYEARVAPDIYFFGFDLTAEKRRGDDTVDDKPGWFFRIEEVPGDARFGFDISRDPATDQRLERSGVGRRGARRRRRHAHHGGRHPAAHAGRADRQRRSRNTRNGSSTSMCRSTPTSAPPSSPISRCRRR